MKIFKDNEELKRILTESDTEASTLMSAVFSFTSMAKIDAVTKEIVERFSRQTLVEIFTPKSALKRNLLMELIANGKNTLSVIEHGWKVVENVLDEESIAAMCMAIDARGYNLLLISAEVCGKKVLHFVWGKIETYVKDTNKVLTHKTQKGKNLLQTSLDNKENLEVFKEIWEILRNRGDFKQFLIEQDSEGNNLIKVLEKKTKSLKLYEEIETFVKHEIKKTFTKAERDEILGTTNSVKKTNIFGFFQ